MERVAGDCTQIARHDLNVWGKGWKRLCTFVVSHNKPATADVTSIHTIKTWTLQPWLTCRPCVTDRCDTQLAVHTSHLRKHKPCTCHACHIINYLSTTQRPDYLSGKLCNALRNCAIVETSNLKAAIHALKYSMSSTAATSLASGRT